MNNHSKSFLGGVLLSVGLASTAFAQDNCTPRHENVQTIEKGYITPAVTIVVPASFLDDSGKLSGIDADILGEIARMECLEIKPLMVDPAAAIQSVVSRRADTPMGGWFRTAERAKIVNLSMPLYVSQMGIWSKDGIDTVDGLMGKRIGAVQGDLWVADAKNVLGDSLTLYPHAVALQQDLVAGRIDAALQSTLAGIAAQQAGALDGIQVKALKADPRIAATQDPGQTNFPVSKDNPSLLAAFNDDITELHNNGTITKILEKYGMEASAGDTGEPRELK